MSNRDVGIRLAGAGDAGAIAAIYAPHVTDGVASFEMVPPDAAEFARRIAGTLPTYPWLVCARGDRVVGYVYASQHNARVAYQWSVNVTVYVDASCHRQNIGRALYVSLFATLRLQGFYNAYAGITLPNDGSVGIHETMGFRLVGIYRDVGYKLARWHDVGWWGMELRPKPAGQPDPPLDVATASLLAGWQTAMEAGLPFLRPAAE